MLIVTPQSTLRDGVYHVHSTDGVAEAQRRVETCLWSHSHLETDLQLKSWGPEWPHWERLQGIDVEMEA